MLFFRERRKLEKAKAKGKKLSEQGLYSQHFPILQYGYGTYKYITKKEKKTLGKQLLTLIKVFTITLEEKLKF